MLFRSSPWPDSFFQRPTTSYAFLRRASSASRSWRAPSQERLSRKVVIKDLDQTEAFIGSDGGSRGKTEELTLFGATLSLPIAVKVVESCVGLKEVLLCGELVHQDLLYLNAMKGELPFS